MRWKMRKKGGESGWVRAGGSPAARCYATGTRRQVGRRQHDGEQRGGKRGTATVDEADTAENNGKDATHRARR